MAKEKWHESYNIMVETNYIHSFPLLTKTYDVYTMKGIDGLSFLVFVFVFHIKY